MVALIPDAAVKLAMRSTCGHRTSEHLVDLHASLPLTPSPHVSHIVCLLPWPEATLL